jgi:hypothetical protein
VEQFLRDKHHRHVSVMRHIGKQVAYVLISFVHQVVYDQQHPLSPVELIYDGQPLLEFDRWIFRKHGLEFSVTVNDLFGRGSYHAPDVFNESKQTTSYPTT